MNKRSFLIFAGSILFVLACEKKPTQTETGSNDSLKSETVAEAPKEAALAGKAALVSKKWKATEFKTPEIKLSGELVNIQFNFMNDGSFQYSEEDKKEKGKWKVNEEGTMLSLEYENGIEADMDIKELKDDKFEITGQLHGMNRTYVLVPTN